MIEAVKDAMRATTGLPDLALHILIGLGAYLVFVAILGRSFRSWWPLLAVLVLEIVNEGFDAAQDFSSEYGISVLGSLFDVFTTMLAPTCIVLLARWSARRPFRTKKRT